MVTDGIVLSQIQTNTNPSCERTKFKILSDTRQIGKRRPYYWELVSGDSFFYEQVGTAIAYFSQFKGPSN